jgi:phosphoribosylglycinamide formyltransferase 1
VTDKKISIAILASGGGSNARVIMDYFRGHARIEVALIVSNKADAGVLGVAREGGITTYILQRHEFVHTEVLLDELREKAIDFVVLAGFLWLIPPYLVKAYEGRIVNIHPALLPKYGGKGMHGHHVHAAVHAAGEPESGMTIHFVNEQYDAGAIIHQATVALTPDDTPDTIAKKVLALEHAHYAPVIEQTINAIWR